MDPIASAQIYSSASKIINSIQQNAGNFREGKAKAFREISYTMLKTPNGHDLSRLLGNSRNAYVHEVIKDITPAQTFNSSEFWQGSTEELAEAYIASISEFSLLDQIAIYARQFPHDLRRAMVATGSTANVVLEGDPKAVIAQELLINPDASTTKTAGIIVMTSDLLKVGGEAARNLFEQELQKAVVRGSNQSVMNSLVDSSTPSASSLEQAMKLAGPSDGYVVAMPAGEVAALALANSNPASNLGVRGGILCPGVHVVAIDDIDYSIVIPASRLAMIDYGLKVWGSTEGDIQMVTDPESGATELVSLFQTNSHALLCEREFLLSGDFSGVVLVESEG